MSCLVALCRSIVADAGGAGIRQLHEMGSIWVVNEQQQHV